MTSSAFTGTSVNSDAPDKSGWSASLYNKNASFVYSPAFTSPVLELLSAKPGERIIDFGSGSGEVTQEIEKVVKQQPAGTVVAVDFSDSMIQKAKERGLNYAFVADIQELEFPSDFGGPKDQFDAVFTNAALHWCKRNPAGVIQGAKRILKKGGRFVGEMGGFMNCIGVRAALHRSLRQRGHDPVVLDPWFFPSVEEYTGLLKSQGFEPTHFSLVPRITPLASGLEGWLSVFVRNSWLKDFEEVDATEIMKEVEDACRIDCQDGEGNWAMLYIRLRFVAVLK